MLTRIHSTQNDFFLTENLIRRSETQKQQPLGSDGGWFISHDMELQY
jgi:hypothetical protein